MAQSMKLSVDCRDFLKGAVAGAATLAGNAESVSAKPKPGPPPPTVAVVKRGEPAHVDAITQPR